MKTELKKLCSEKAIEAIKTETTNIKEISKVLSYSYNLIRKEIKK